MQFPIYFLMSLENYFANYFLSKSIDKIPTTWDYLIFRQCYSFQRSHRGNRMLKKTADFIHIGLPEGCKMAVHRRGRETRVRGLYIFWNCAQSGARIRNDRKMYFFLLSTFYRTKPFHVMKCLRVKWFTIWQPEIVRKINGMRCFPCCMHNFAARCFSWKLRYHVNEFN